MNDHIRFWRGAAIITALLRAVIFAVFTLLASIANAQDTLPPFTPTAELPECTRPITVSPCRCGVNRCVKRQGPRPESSRAPWCTGNPNEVNCRDREAYNSDGATQAAASVRASAATSEFYLFDFGEYNRAVKTVSGWALVVCIAYLVIACLFGLPLGVNRVDKAFQQYTKTTDELIALYEQERKGK